MAGAGVSPSKLLNFGRGCEGTGDVILAGAPFDHLDPDHQLHPKKAASFSRFADGYDTKEGKPFDRQQARK